MSGRRPTQGGEQAAGGRVAPGDTARGLAVREKAGRGEPAADEMSWTNDVVLSGRLAATPERRELPSGDAVVQLRIIIPRDVGSGVGPGRRTGPGGRAATVDTIDVSCWTKGLQRQALRWRAGDVLRVRGALRRRFWRVPTGAASRYEVEAQELARVSVRRP